MTITVIIPVNTSPKIDETPDIRHVLEAARQAVQTANDKDDELIDAVRADLAATAATGAQNYKIRLTRCHSLDTPDDTL